ncbi:MAG: rhodanese-like domain-containing protein [Chloroflexi bacterium]|nr:rhodanese-like domain-containing protein [Chloroflexota bacterium]
MSLLSQLFGPPIPQLDASTAKAKLDEKPRPFLLDVREPEEFHAGHIANATLIPLRDLGRRIHELPRDRAIICVCHSGNRSSSATRQLLAAGYNVTNLHGGMLAWSRSNLPIKQGSR